MRPSDGMDAKFETIARDGFPLQSALTDARDGGPGRIGVLVHVSFSNFISIR